MTAREKQPPQNSGRRAHDLLRSSIRMGLTGADSTFVESDLMTSMASTRDAVREALQLLAEEGLIERTPRTGTRLTASIFQIPMEQFLPLVGDGVRDRVTIRELECRMVEASPVVAARLEVGVGEKLEMAEQLISVDGSPVAVRCCYVRPEFIREPLEYTPVQQLAPRDLASMMARVYGSDALDGVIENFLEAMPCEPRTSAQLGIDVGAPILVRELLIRDRSGIPYLFGYARYRGDRVAISADVTIEADPFS